MTNIKECPNCGNEYSIIFSKSEVKFCPACGGSLSVAENKSEKNHYDSTNQDSTVKLKTQANLDMKWYKFLTGGGLFWLMILELIVGLFYLSIAILNELMRINDDIQFYVWEKIPDIWLPAYTVEGILSINFHVSGTFMIGSLLILMGAFLSLYALIKLGQYRADGVKIMFASYILVTIAMFPLFFIIECLYLWDLYIWISPILEILALIVFYCPAIVFIIMNIVYFRKRKDMFVKEA